MNMLLSEPLNHSVCSFTVVVLLDGDALSDVLKMCVLWLEG